MGLLGLPPAALASAAAASFFANQLVKPQPFLAALASAARLAGSDVSDTWGLKKLCRWD